MAAPMERLSQILADTLNRVLADSNISFRKIEITRKDVQSNNGDLFLTKGCFGNEGADIVSVIRDDFISKCQSLDIPVRDVSSDKYNSLIISFHRPPYFALTIETILQNGSRYGCVSLDCNQTVLMNPVVMTAPEEMNSLDDPPVTVVRALLLHMHASLLLKAHGYTVKCPTSKWHYQKLTSLMGKIGIDDKLFTASECVSDDELKSFSEKLLKHPCAEVIKDGSCNLTDSALNPCYCFNLRNYIQKHLSPAGSTQYNKNLNLCNMVTDGKESDIVAQTCFLLNNLKVLQPSSCIHVVSQASAVRAQKVQLLIHAALGVADSPDEPTPQALYVYGPVVQVGVGASEDKVSADQYISLRFNQMREAAVSKYGSTVNGEGWEATLKELTASCIKFELLSATAKSQVKLRLGEDRSCDTTLSGLFVMYNCARLSTLMSHFDQAVKDGTYPPLPDIGHIDFALLREEQEWGLLWNHLCVYPDIVGQCVPTPVVPTSLHAGLHTHKICQFLISLSQALSSYYSRFHVLGEGRPQLLPTMFARIYLLKAVHQTFINALSLLNIQPLNQL